MHKFNHDFSCILAIFAVSLFTREWIEMWQTTSVHRQKTVSLFTREWIEIVSNCIANSSSEVSLFTREWIEILSLVFLIFWLASSPSLRGSGLKFRYNIKWYIQILGLPLYEGVDWNKIISDEISNNNVSLFTREWIEISCSSYVKTHPVVSLFTREWIEMLKRHSWKLDCHSLPLYEGVDWNAHPRII